MAAATRNDELHDQVAAARTAVKRSLRAAHAANVELARLQEMLASVGIGFTVIPKEEPHA